MFKSLINWCSLLSLHAHRLFASKPLVPAEQHRSRRSVAVVSRSGRRELRRVLPSRSADGLNAWWSFLTLACRSSPLSCCLSFFCWPVSLSFSASDSESDMLVILLHVYHVWNRLGERKITIRIWILFWDFLDSVSGFELCWN